MSSGQKREIINTLERALSGDINDLQDFVAFANQQMARSLQGARERGTLGNIDFPGLRTFPDAVEAASGDNHDCYAGLMVRPDSDGFLLIDEGVAGFLAPSFPGLGAGDTPYIIVTAPAVTDTGLLPFTANVGAGIRWEVVECQPVDTLVSSQTRDIFDPVSNTFVPTTVDKVRETQLTYRIRSGVAGSGDMPSPDPDWMPLAAVMVPVGASGFTECDVYDLRPLVHERARFQKRRQYQGAAIASGHRTVLSQAEFFSESQSGAPHGTDARTLYGYYLTEFEDWMVGGVIRKNTGNAGTANFGSTTAGFGGEDPSFDPNDTENQAAAGFGGGTSRVLAVGAFFPHGYPRWVRYSQVSLSADVPTPGRYPRGPKGILVAYDLDGGGVTTARSGFLIGSTSTTMPSQMGLGAMTDAPFGHVVGFLARLSAGEIVPPYGGGAEMKFIWEGVDTGQATSNFNEGVNFSTVIAGPGSLVTNSFVAGAGLNPYPSAARGLCFQINQTFVQSVDEVVFTQTWRAGIVESGPLVPIPGPGTGGLNYMPSGSPSMSTGGTIWVPLKGQPNWDGFGGPSTTVAIRTDRLNGAGSIDIAGGTARLIGYQL